MVTQGSWAHYGVTVGHSRGITSQQGARRRRAVCRVHTAGGRCGRGRSARASRLVSGNPRHMRQARKACGMGAAAAPSRRARPLLAAALGLGLDGRLCREVDGRL